MKRSYAASLVVAVLAFVPNYANSDPIATLFNTGRTTNGTLLAEGDLDPHYGLITSPDALFPGPQVFVVLSTGHPVPNSWLANGPNSEWIAPRSLQDENAGGGNEGGIYLYRTTFDLTGYNPTTAHITGQWSTDNVGLDILINGTSTGHTIPNIEWQSLHDFTIDSGFISGINTLDFMLSNDGGPTGLRVEVAGTVGIGQTFAQWSSAVNGAYEDGTRWTGGVAPIDASQIIFNKPGTYEVVHGSDHANAGMEVRQGNVTFDFTTDTTPRTHTIWTTGDATIGDAPGDNAILTLKDGAARYRSVTVGKQAGSTGTLNTSMDDDWNYDFVFTTDHLVVGENGTGNMTVDRSDFHMKSAGNDLIDIGRGNGSQGTLTLTGARTQLIGTSNSVLTVGGNSSADSNGHGVLHVLSGATATVSRLQVAESPSSIGMVSLLGAGTKIVVTSSVSGNAPVEIGANGEGSMTIQNGASLQVANNIFVGGGEESSSFVGDSHAKGTLTVSNGTVSSRAFYIGAADAALQSDNAVYITGPSSVVTTELVFWVGLLERGRLVISNGGTLHSVTNPSLVAPGSVNRSAVIGGFSTSDGNGEVVVTGSGSTWTTGESMAVGRFGPGELKIADGGYVESHSNSNGRSGRIGDRPGIAGKVTITGANSRWMQDGQMAVGLQGYGTLIVESGGSIQSVTGVVASDPNTTGDTTIGGATSAWAVSQSLYVGGNSTAIGGVGLLTVSNSGQVTVGQKLHLWSSGTVNVSNAGIINVGGGTPPAPGALRVGNGGTLSGNGAVVGNVIADGGTVSPGTSPGVLHINGNFNQLAGSLLALEIGGTAAATEYDQLFVTGDLTLEGNVQISLIKSFLPAAGNKFDLFTVGGTFTPGTITFTNLPPDFKYTPSFNGGVFSIVINPDLGLLGDYNSDDRVDAADYIVWRKLKDQTGPSLAADGTGPSGTPDGIVDQLDYELWRANFGNTSPGMGNGTSAPSNVSVPEPTAWILSMVAGFIVVSGVRAMAPLRATGHCGHIVAMAVPSGTLRT